MVSCRFAHSFKIVRIPQPRWTDVILPCIAQTICSGRGDEIDIAYIRCIDSRVTEAFENWALAEDGIYKVHLFARVKIRDDFSEGHFL